MSKDRRQYRIPLKGEDAVLWLSIPLSAANWEQMMNVLDAMQPGLVVAENTRLTDVELSSFNVGVTNDGGFIDTPENIAEGSNE